MRIVSAVTCLAPATDGAMATTRNSTRLFEQLRTVQYMSYCAEIYIHITLCGNVRSLKSTYAESWISLPGRKIYFLGLPDTQASSL